MRHTRRKERDGLDLARPAPRRRHKTLRQLCALLLGLAGLALLSMAVWGAALPRRLDDALAQHYAAQMSVMQRELFALRRRLAEHEPDAEENAALRNFLQSRQTDGERWDPVWTAARWPGGFLLAQPVQAGAAVLDRSGRFAGIAGEHGTVSPAGSGAGRRRWPSRRCSSGSSATFATTPGPTRCPAVPKAPARPTPCPTACAW